MTWATLDALLVELEALDKETKVIGIEKMIPREFRRKIDLLDDNSYEGKGIMFVRQITHQIVSIFDIN